MTDVPPSSTPLSKAPTKSIHQVRPFLTMDSPESPSFSLDYRSPDSPSSPSPAPCCNVIAIASLPIFLLLIATGICGGLIELLHDRRRLAILYGILGAAILQAIILTITAIVYATKRGATRSFILLIPMGLAVISAAIVIGAALYAFGRRTNEDDNMAAWLVVAVIAGPVGALSFLILCGILWCLSGEYS